MISIITPTYNRERLISETLDSILVQEYSNWEAIVVDDGSTDQTCAVVEKYAQEDARIKLLRRDREPKGAPTCRNIGIENAQGEYLMFLDSDDLLTPGALQNRSAYVQEKSELDFAVFQMGVLGHDGGYSEDGLVKKHTNYLYAFLRHELPWTITGPLWKTKFVREKIGGYNEAYPRLQDPEFNTRALLIDSVRFEVLYNSAPDSYYRAHTDKVFNVSILLYGFELYIKDFFDKTKLRSDFFQCKDQLKYCFIEAVKGFYAYNRNDFTNNDLDKLKQIKQFAYSNAIINKRTNNGTTLLLWLYRLRVNRVPLGKYLLRFVMKQIKNS